MKIINAIKNLLLTKFNNEYNNLFNNMNKDISNVFILENDSERIILIYMGTLYVITNDFTSCKGYNLNYFLIKNTDNDTINLSLSIGNTTTDYFNNNRPSLLSLWKFKRLFLKNKFQFSKENTMKKIDIFSHLMLSEIANKRCKISFNFDKIF